MAMVLVVTGGHLIWKNYFAYDEVKVYEEVTRKYVEAMTADTYGGKTPQETLDMFVDALRKGDVELASKYFMLDDNLSREKWVDYLLKLKQKNLLSRLADDIEKEARSVGSVYEGNFQFKLYNDDGTTGLLINMQLNKHSNVWKIESL